MLSIIFFFISTSLLTKDLKLIQYLCEIVETYVTFELKEHTLLYMV